MMSRNIQPMMLLQEMYLILFLNQKTANIIMLEYETRLFSVYTSFVEGSVRL